MNIAPINNIKYVSKPLVFKGKDDKNIPLNNEKNSGMSKKKVCGLVAATALTAATIGGIIARKNANRSLANLRNRMRPQFELEEQVQSLTKEKDRLQQINNKLKKEFEKAKEDFGNIFEGDTSPKEAREKLVNELKAKIENGDYGYDISTPPVTGKKAPTKGIDDIIQLNLPNKVGTTNRIGMQDLRIPEISTDGRFNLAIPTSSEVKITHSRRANFSPTRNQLTNISEDYATSVQWNNDKIARDLMQNFYDGHGQTLDGVVMRFEPTGNGKYRVRIEGKSTYTPDKAAYIGESSKRDDPRAAGNYGEGIKMATLKLLKDYGANDVKIASDDWRLIYNLQQGNLSEKRVLAYSLEQAPKFDGNYIEFETNNRGLLESLRNTVNRFYHSSNSDFKCPDFENSLLGLKVLPRNQKGGIYIAGQRFEFNGNYDGLEGLSLFIKEKPPTYIIDPSRDRTTLNESNLRSLGRWIANSSSATSKEDKLKILKSLERYWDVYSKTPVDEFLEGFIDTLDLRQVDMYGFRNRIRNTVIKFPEKCVAYSNASDEVLLDLRLKGYTVCKEEFAKLGMPTIKDLYGDARAHDVIIPNETQKKKILILKEALRKLAPSLEDTHFTPEELDTKIFLFDRTSARDSRIHNDALAEAIIDNGTSKGFWIDKGYLDEADFNYVLETALHELSHKVGGDESSIFSYKLTKVNRDAIGQLLSDAKCRTEMQALNNLWNSLK